MTKVFLMFFSILSIDVFCDDNSGETVGGGINAPSYLSRAYSEKELNKLLRVGMPPKEVISILGNPTSITEDSMTYITAMEQDSNHEVHNCGVDILIRNGKVIKWNTIMRKVEKYQTLPPQIASNVSEPFIFEFHKIFDTPSENTIEMQIYGNESALVTHTKSFHVEKVPFIDMSDISSAIGLKNLSNPGCPAISLFLNEKGSKKNIEMTKNSIRKPVALIIGGKLIGTPIIMSQAQGNINVTLSITEIELSAIVEKINSCKSASKPAPAD